MAQGCWRIAPGEDTRFWKRGKGTRFKRIEVLAVRRLSYQRHEKRPERGRVVEGEAVVALEGKEIPPFPGEPADIPRMAAHRIRNAGWSPLAFIEIQRGEYLGEEDIIRLEDDFGRNLS